MRSMKLMRVCDFEWASVCQYIVYLSNVAALDEIRMSGINDFPYATVGGMGLRRRKVKALSALKSNRSKLEAFVGVHRDSIEDVELAVIRGMYRQLVDGEKTVKNHLDRIERLLLTECEVRELDFEGEGGDAFPF